MLSAGFRTTVLPFYFLPLTLSVNLSEYDVTIVHFLLAESEKNFCKIERFMCVRDRTSSLQFFSEGYFCFRSPLVARKKRFSSRPSPACRNRSIRTESTRSTRNSRARRFCIWPRAPTVVPEAC